MAQSHTRHRVTDTASAHPGLLPAADPCNPAILPRGKLRHPQKPHSSQWCHVGSTGLRGILSHRIEHGPLPGHQVPPTIWPFSPSSVLCHVLIHTNQAALPPPQTRPPLPPPALSPPTGMPLLLTRSQDAPHSTIFTSCAHALGSPLQLRTRLAWEPTGGCRNAAVRFPSWALKDTVAFSVATHRGEASRRAARVLTQPRQAASMARS